MNVNQKILNYLSKPDGYNTLTTAQARARFGIKNVSARIEELRLEGHAIYTNSRILDDGRKVTFYRLGTPSKKVVSAGYQVLRGMGVSTFA